MLHFNSRCLSAQISAHLASLSAPQVDHPFCWSRNSAFILYGALYQGCCQEIIFNDIYPKIFGIGTDVATVMMPSTSILDEV
jgi:hypothetical protein